MQFGMDLFGRHHVLLRVVKTTAMDRPHGTVHPFFEQIGGVGLQKIVV